MLAGRALGDALGAPLFLSSDELRHRHGPGGVTGYQAGDWEAGTFSDDTQMTVFAPERPIRTDARFLGRVICNAPRAMWRAHRRRMHTPSAAVPWEPALSPGPSGWLVNQPELRARRPVASPLNSR
ncbi:MAG: ADP-ribosylglycohydrolase family protein [Candidatus Dormibacteria bacterium]